MLKDGEISLSITRFFWHGIIIFIAIVLWGSFAPNNLNSITGTVTAFISDRFGWFYMLGFITIIAFSVYLMFSRFGKIKLGKEDDEPDFSLRAWFAMLFSAGMGLVFFTTSETISHAFIKAANTALGSEQAIIESLQYAAFH